MVNITTALAVLHTIHFVHWLLSFQGTNPVQSSAFTQVRIHLLEEDLLTCPAFSELIQYL